MYKLQTTSLIHNAYHQGCPRDIAGNVEFVGNHVQGRNKAFFCRRGLTPKRNRGYHRESKPNVPGGTNVVNLLLHPCDKLLEQYCNRPKLDASDKMYKDTKIPKMQQILDLDSLLLEQE